MKMRPWPYLMLVRVKKYPAGHEARQGGWKNVEQEKANLLQMRNIYVKLK